MPVNWINSLCCLLIQCSLSLFLKKKRLQIFIPKFNQIKLWNFFYITFIAGVSLKYLSLVYGTFPTSIPHISQPIFDEEISFISYVSNVRRKNPLIYEESRFCGYFYRGYSIPLLYTASLMSLGASYSDASITICFLNIIATAFVISSQSAKHLTWYLIPCFFFFFSGPSAARLYFSDKNRNDIRNDLVHQYESNHQTISYQPFFVLLTISKVSSYTIALTQYAMLHTNCYLTLLIPNLPATIGVFISFIVRKKSNIKRVWPTCLFLALRLFPFNLQFYPLFREEAMRGSLFAAFKIWFDVFSIALCALIYIEYFPKVTNIIIPNLAAFCVLMFVRESNDRLINLTAIISIFSPILYILATIVMKRFVYLPDSEEMKGCMLYVFWAVFFTFIGGGFICAMRIIQSKEEFIGKDERGLIEMIEKLTPKGEILFFKSHLLHPSILAGRPAFLGDKRALFLGGYNITQRLLEYKEVLRSNFSHYAMKKYNIHYVIDSVEQSFFTDGELPKILDSNSKYRICKF